MRQGRLNAGQPSEAADPMAINRVSQPLELLGLPDIAVLMIRVAVVLMLLMTADRNAYDHLEPCYLLHLCQKRHAIFLIEVLQNFDAEHYIKAIRAKRQEMGIA
jgi:hypothetical protein